MCVCGPVVAAGAGGRAGGAGRQHTRCGSCSGRGWCVCCTCDQCRQQLPGEIVHSRVCHALLRLELELDGCCGDREARNCQQQGKQLAAAHACCLCCCCLYKAIQLLDCWLHVPNELLQAQQQMICGQVVQDKSRSKPNGFQEQERDFKAARFIREEPTSCAPRPLCQGAGRTPR